MSDAPTATSRLIGEIFVERGLVTAEQLESALEMQLRTGDRLGEILVGHFGVPRLELASVLAEQWTDADRNVGTESLIEATSVGAPAPPSLEQVEREVEEIDRRPIGEIFVQGGFVTAEELERALVTQRETGQRLGEVLVSQGSITRLELASALAEQWAGLPKLRPPAPHAGTGGHEIRPAAAVPESGSPETPVAPVQTAAVDAALGSELRGELERQREALEVVLDRVERPDERFGELAARLEELAARTVSSAELDTLRSELEALAARPAGDPALAARIDDIAVKLHAIGDMEALRASLAERVEELAVRVHEVAALDGDLRALRASIDELHARAGVDESARTRLDQLAARLDEHGSAPTELDGSLSARLEELEHRVSGAAGADDVRQAFDAVREEMREVAAQFDEAPDLEAVNRRLDAIDARLSDSSEQHKIRTAISDLQAELAALGGRDERGRLDSLVERLDVLEGGLPSQAVLDTLRDDVAGLLARPAVDSALAQRVDELAARLDDHAALAGELAGLRATVEGIDARPPVDEEARTRLDELAQYVQSLADTPAVTPDETLVPRLGEVERRLDLAAAGDDVRDAFAAVRAEVRDVAAQIEGLPAPVDTSVELEAIRGSLAELAARPVADPALATRLEGLSRRVDELGDALAAEVDDTLAPRLDELERRLSLAAASADVGEALAAVREEMREVSVRLEQRPGLDGISERLDSLERHVSDRGELEVLSSSLRALHAELQTLADRGDSGRLDALHARIDQVERALGDPAALESLRADVEAMHAHVAGLPDHDRLRGRVDELEARLASTDGLETLRSELEAVAARPSGDPSMAARLDQVAARLHELAGETARNDDVVALREAVARLELRPLADPSLPERLGELVRRAETWQASADGVRELRLLVAELEARPQPDPTLVDRLAELEGRLEAVAAGASGRGELDELRDAVARLEQRPSADPELPAHVVALADRVDTLAASVAGGEELQALRESVARLEAKPQPYPELPAHLHALSDRIDLLEPASQRLDELTARVAELSARPDVDPALAGRLEEVERRLEESLGLAAAIERIDGELVRLGDGVDQATAGARAAAALEATLLARVDEAIAESREQAESTGHELGRRVDDVAAQLGALDELSRRADELAAGSGALRKELKGLAKAAESREAAFAESLERTAVTARSEHERLGAAIEELASAGADRDVRLESLSHELSSRLAALAGQAHADAEARAGIAELRETLASLGDALDDFAGGRGLDAEQAEAAAADLNARLEELAQHVVASRTELAEELRAELSSLASRVEENDAAGVVIRDEGRVELERVAASLGWRLERVEEALSAEDREELQRTLGDLVERLDAQEARQDEQVRVTERALRKGLASLGDRLADKESEYAKAGNALRRSIERLGSVIVEADVATAERGTEETLALHHANATSYVAFAPTSDGYRLVAVEGRPPEVGARVELPQCDGELIVSRLGASPIPLDTRPCAYLERA